MQNLSQQLLEAYDKECRKELSIALAQAYLHSHMKAKEFGSLGSSTVIFALVLCRCIA